MKTGKKTISVLLLFTLFILLLLAGGFLYLKQTELTVTFSSEVPEESAIQLNNPYRGFYQIYGLTLTNDDISNGQALAERVNSDKNHTLALLEINLKNFKDEPLSPEALAQLDCLLARSHENGHQLIVRFLYDWDGKAPETEPDSIETIEGHMEQVAYYVNQQKDHIYLLQGIFLGDCGEMHHSKHMDTDSMRRLLAKWADVTDPSIYLSVRTPAHWRIANNRTTPLGESEAFSPDPASRLGLFNDGMMGSDIDLGTYGTSSFAGSSNPADKGTRKEELDFQGQLCRFTPNGGECVLDNPFNDFENAIVDLKKMRVSYLNSEHDITVINKWKNSTFQSDNFATEASGPETSEKSPAAGSSTEIFNGMNGFDYISAHLGYRYVLKEAALNFERHIFHPKATLTISITNVGFSPAYKPFDSVLWIENSETGERTECALTFDNRMLDAGQTAEIAFPLDLKNTEKGIYRMYFQMQDSVLKRAINLANEALADTETLPEESCIPLGTLTIS